MTAVLYHGRLEKALDRMGGLYTLNDILRAISEGRMQSWVEGNSWVITQVAVYPRTRVLEVVAAVGDLRECRLLIGRVLEYAKEEGIGLVAAHGRRGWASDALKHGWARPRDKRGWKIKTTSYLYHREM
jgi:hypothetical protein